MPKGDIVNEPSKKKRGFVFRLFSGDVELVITYWVFGVLFSWILNLINVAIERYYVSCTSSNHFGHMVAWFKRHISSSGWQLLKVSKMAYAIRYSIPTVIIFWNSIEILGRWNYFEEVWVEPTEYILETILIFGGFLLAVLISVYTSRKNAQST